MGCADDRPVRLWPKWNLHCKDLAAGKCQGMGNTFWLNCKLLGINWRAVQTPCKKTWMEHFIIYWNDFGQKDNGVGKEDEPKLWTGDRGRSFSSKEGIGRLAQCALLSPITSQIIKRLKRAISKVQTTPCCHIDTSWYCQIFWKGTIWGT